jgi:hypothetical protein
VLYIAKPYWEAKKSRGRKDYGRKKFMDIMNINALQEAIAGFQTNMLIGLVRIALTLVIAGVAFAKADKAYGTSGKVVCWSIAALAAAIVWMI